MIDEKKLIEEFRKSHISFNGTPMEESDMMISYRSLVRVINEQPKVGEWIPCSEELPPMPTPNPLCEGRNLELYLVTEKHGDYPWRAFWNGKSFSDGFSKVEVIAWMPLPEAYRKDGE